MNTVWSEEVQGVMTLYLSRKLRFHDRFARQYKELFALDTERTYRILEIGCGPGALAGALHRWYPRAEIVGVDRDSRFIHFARENEPAATFIEGDAANLPFADNTFDITISYTVQEHIEPSAFWGEQRRVLKPGGICLCLSTRKNLICKAPCLETTAAEEAFWAQIPAQQQTLETYQVCRYPLSEAALPASMEENGFAEVSTGYVVVDLTPDDPKYPSALAEAMIEADRQSAVEAILSAHAKQPEDVLAAVEEKYRQRVRLYRAGKKQWDTETVITMVSRGVK